ncbi:hypothetical protein ACPVPU_08210 [Sphingomonas sp. CJ99]
MPNREPAPELARIEAALARIECAAAARTAATEALARRHAALKAGMADAVAVLDGLIARRDAAEEQD